MNLYASFDFSLQQRSVLERAAALLCAGEAEEGRAVLAALKPGLIGSAEEAVVAAEMFLELSEFELALASATRATALNPGDPDARELLAECRRQIDLPEVWRSESEQIRSQLRRLDALASGPRPAAEHVHIVCRLDSFGGSERRALNLRRLLRGQIATTLWSTAAPHQTHLETGEIRTITPESSPAGGTLVLIGTFFPTDNWLQQNRFERVVVCHNLMIQNAGVLNRLRELEANPSHPRVQLTFPSRMFRDMLGLPGDVEYTCVDLAHFQCRQPRNDSVSNLSIGRHGRQFPLKFHPNDPSFFRKLIARGYRVRLVGGSVISTAFSSDTGPVPEWIEVGKIEMRDFLETLDIFVYRKHPQFIETGGSVILEAMAMELPVIVFSEQCGCAELIAHGENGFLVSSEAEAYDIIERLRADPELRRRVGAAARRTLIDLQRRQEPELLARYREEPPR